MHLNEKYDFVFLGDDERKEDFQDKLIQRNVEMAEFLPLCDVLFNVISLAGYFCDVVFDVVMGYALLERGYKGTFAAAISIVIMSLLISQVRILREKSANFQIYLIFALNSVFSSLLTHLTSSKKRIRLKF